ncbi:signal peptidase I [Nocardioides montaniterrae]
MRTVVRWTVNLTLVAAFLVAAAYVVPSLTGYARYVITGGSMTGTYDKGSMVFEKEVTAADLKVGDVITYQPPASSGVTWLVTHRIIKIGHDAHGRQVLRTQGDANPKPDPWSFSLTASKQNVVRTSVPYVGWALIVLADRQYRMLLIGLPAALIALLSLVELVSGLRTRPRQVSVGGSIGATGPV